MFGQDSKPERTKRLNFYLGASLLIQKTDYTVITSRLPSPGYAIYPSLDINFSLKSKRPQGWNIEYSNPLIGESLMNAILHWVGILDKESYLMEHTISSGLFGRIDFGKNLAIEERRRLTAGLVISDKFISDIYYKPFYGNGANMAPDAEGYFITPGVYVELARTTAKNHQFSLNTSLTPSVLNLYKVKSNINYMNHLFNETNLKIITKKGWFYKAGTIIVIPYFEYSPKFRLSLTIGHRLF
jgi:hypothetical protein